MVQKRQIYQARKSNFREVKQTFLIVCEGTETERNYFESFRVSKYVKIVTKGIGRNPSQVVKQALNLSQKDDYDQVWCVFDRDPSSVTVNDFNTAIQEAKNNNFQVAYSNECFELWYFLHFHFINTPINKNNCEKQLTLLLNMKYQKNSTFMYDKLQDKQSTALKNAEILLKQYHPKNPAQDNPSTTVHLLVQELNKFMG